MADAPPITPDVGHRKERHPIPPAPAEPPKGPPETDEP